jgi:hypothetical protein
MAGEDHDAAANGAALEAEVKKKDSHSDHRDVFVASEGLTTQGEAPLLIREIYFGLRACGRWAAADSPKGLAHIWACLSSTAAGRSPQLPNFGPSDKPSSLRASQCGGHSSIRGLRSCLRSFRREDGPRPFFSQPLAGAA